MKSGIRQNLILVTATVICMVLAFVLGINLTMPSVVALEQDARCGIAEHIHREDCYLNNVLICGEKAHTHGENCYLLRLEDNDINRILSEIEADEEKSLEHVITNVVYKASYLELVNEGVLPAPTPTPTPTPTPLIELLPEGSSLETLTATNASVAALNDSIEENNITPALYLNERLISPASEGGTVSDSENIVNLTQGQNSPTDLVTYAANANSGVSTLAVGESAATTGDNVNFYIMLDDELVCIGHKALQPVSIWQYNRNYTYYCTTRSDTAERYNDGLISNITADNISYNNNGTYYLRYTTSKPSGENSFNNGSAQRPSSNYNDHLSFGTNGGLKYAIITTRTESGNWWNPTYTYTPVDFYTVTIDYSDDSDVADQVQYVQDGLDSTLTFNTDTYDYYTNDEYSGTALTATELSAALSDIDAITTIYARPKGPVVTFNSNGGSAVASQTVTTGGTAKEPAAPTRTGYTFTGWYTDEDCTDAFNFDTPINQDQTVYAGWKINTYTVTYYKEDGTTVLLQTEPINYGTTYTVAYNNLPTGCTAWVDMDDPSASYDPDEAKTITVTRNYRFRAASNFIVTYVDRNGNSTTTQVTPGYSLTIKAPEAGYVWVDEDGNQYSENASLVVTRNITLTAKPYITISYNVNFPNQTAVQNKVQGTTYQRDNQINIPASPTLRGLDVTEKNDDIAAKDTTVQLRNISSREVLAETTTKAKFKYCFYFTGWETEDSTVVQPGTNLSYYQLLEYDEDGDGIVEFTGQWDHGTSAVANFCIDLDSKLTSSGATSDYTDSIFATYVGGDGNISLSATTATLKPVDEEIRSLHGAMDNDVWFYNFPSDTYVFDKLKEELAAGTNLRIEDEIIKVEELNSEYFTIRWTTLFYSAWDSWHVDGILVHKEGKITVDKEFYGDEAAIEAAKKDFYIVAQNGKVEDGKFTPYTSDATNFKQYVLTFDTDDLSTAVQNEIANLYPNAVILRQDASGTEFTGTIENVHLGEFWQISEHALPVTQDGTEYIFYSEYSVYDTDGVVSAVAEYGTTAQVVGKTFALDEDPTQGLMVDFRNYYYPSNSLLIKKEDGNTGVAIGGAAFELWQYNSYGQLVQLKFSVNSDGNYYFDPDTGTETQIYTGSEGFTTINIEDFSYEHGDVLVREVMAPSGYDMAPSVLISNNKDGMIVAPYVKDILYENGGAEISSAEFSKYAEVYDNGQTVVIKDYSTLETSLSVNKVWDGDTTADSVTVVLQANGTIASNTFPGMTDITQTLSAANSWTYTWTQLPVYANGEIVEWGIKEIMVGDETTSSDGVTFANWIASYSAPVRTDSNGDGITDNWSYTVTNTVRRTMIILTKVDGDGAALPGAGFTLTEVVHSGSSWTTAAGGITINAVSDSNGVIIFDNLTAGKYYKLSETSTPEYFWPLDDVVVTVDGTGVVKLAEISAGTVVTSDLNGYYHTYTNPYNIRVKNISAKPLPETGGMGTHIYTAGGLLLMAAAVALLIYRRKRRKEADLLDV